MDFFLAKIYVDFCWHLQAKTLDQIALNYIPTSWSRDKFLILVTFLYLAIIIIIMATYPLM